MAPKRTITNAQRFGVWKSWSGRCFWCKEPTVFKNCHIDHALPLRAAENEGGMATLRALYNLPSDFDLDSFSNWVPACPGCNQSKSDLLIDASPAVALILAQVRSKARLAEAIADGIERDSKKAPLIAKLAHAVTAGDITKEEIEQLLAGLPVLIRKAAELPEEVLLIAPGWKIVQRIDGRDLVIVRTAGGATGVTSLSPTADYSWTCPTCGNRGPWEGVICRSCGYRSEPD